MDAAAYNPGTRKPMFLNCISAPLGGRFCRTPRVQNVCGNIQRPRAISAGGGSEFRAAFEHACQQHGIALYVLPPKSPKYNAHVERAHRTLREEFYGQYRRTWDLQTLNTALHAFQQHYCHHRPHGGKHQNFQTPMAYYQSLKEAA